MKENNNQLEMDSILIPKHVEEINEAQKLPLAVNLSNEICILKIQIITTEVDR